MIREKEIINHIKEYLDSGMWEYEACDLRKEDLEIIVKALEKQPCEDFISRKATLEEIENGIKAGNHEEGYEAYAPINNIEDIIKCIKYRVQPKLNLECDSCDYKEWLKKEIESKANVLNKIRAEIETEWLTDDKFSVADCIDIIDEYRS